MCILCEETAGLVKYTLYLGLSLDKTQKLMTKMNVPC